MSTFKRILQSLLRRAGGRGTSAAPVGVASHERPSEPRRFRHDEFASDPSEVMRSAERDGAALITADDGTPRIRIGAPLERTLILD